MTPFAPGGKRRGSHRAPGYSVKEDAVVFFFAQILQSRNCRQRDGKRVRAKASPPLADLP
jgi:hypothetical protein